MWNISVNLLYDNVDIVRWKLLTLSTTTVTHEVNSITRTLLTTFSIIFILTEIKYFSVCSTSTNANRKIVSCVNVKRSPVWFLGWFSYVRWKEENKELNNCYAVHYDVNFVFLWNGKHKFAKWFVDLASPRKNNFGAVTAFTKMMLISLIRI